MKELFQQRYDLLVGVFDKTAKGDAAPDRLEKVIESCTAKDDSGGNDT